MKNGKPEEKKVQNLIEDFKDMLISGEDKLYRACDLSEEDWVLLHDFIYWLYVHKEYMIIPQKMSESYISDVHLT